MNNNFQKGQILVSLIISIWILIIPVYLHFSSFDELEIPSSPPCVRNMDQEDPIVTEERMKLSGFNVISKDLFKTSFRIDRILDFFPQISSLNLKSLVLRC